MISAYEKIKKIILPFQKLAYICGRCGNGAAVKTSQKMNTVNKTLALTVTPIAITDLKANSARNYNTVEWDKKINLYDQKNKDIQFYVKPADKVFSYDRFFVKYTIEEGIIFFSQFGYSSSLTSNSFLLIEIEHAENGDVNIFKSCYEDRNYKPTGISNTKEGRRYMANRSKFAGEIFSNSI